jgi:integrase
VRQKQSIRPITLAGGRVRYRAVMDVGVKPDGKREQRTQTFDKQKDAEKWVRETRVAVDKQTYVRPTKTTVDTYLDEWLAALHGKRPATLRSYQDALRPVRALLGGKPIQDVKKSDVELVKARMLDGSLRSIGRKGQPLSPRSVNLMLTIFQAAVQAAVDDEIVTRNVVRLVKHVEGSGSRAGVAWKVEQVQRFETLASRDRLHAAWLLTVHGLRRGEVLGLRWERGEGDEPRHSWVDLDEGTLSIAGPEATRTVVAGEIVLGPPKTTNGVRDLPLTDEMVRALRKLRKRQAEERLGAGSAYEGSGFVVVNEAGEPVRPEWYSDTFGRLARQAGLPRIRLHDARHTSVTAKRALGWPDHLVAAWHGHDETVMRKTYTHVTLDDLREVARTRPVVSGL